MSVYRSEHKGNYSIVSNDLLRNTELSSTAKMVLLICLSLPDEWSYNIRGLCTFTREGQDAIGRAIRELEDNGYIERRKVRDKGKIMRVEYDIFEDLALRPQSDTEKPDMEKPDKEKPEPEKPNQGLPNQDIPALSIQDLPITDIVNNYNTNTLSTNQVRAMEDAVRKQIEYDIMCQRYDPRLLDNIVAVLLSAMLDGAETISLGKDTVYPAGYVRERLAMINAMHIEQLMESLIRSKPIIHNVRAYLLKSLINTVNTIDMGYQYAEE